MVRRGVSVCTAEAEMGAGRGTLGAFLNNPHSLSPAVVARAPMWLAGNGLQDPKDIIGPKRHSRWTVKEELRLVELHREFQGKWAQVARYLPGRTPASISRYWRVALGGGDIQRIQHLLVDGKVPSAFPNGIPPLPGAPAAGAPSSSNSSSCAKRRREEGTGGSAANKGKGTGAASKKGAGAAAAAATGGELPFGTGGVLPFGATCKQH